MSYKDPDYEQAPVVPEAFTPADYYDEVAEIVPKPTMVVESQRLEIERIVLKDTVWSRIMWIANLFCEIDADHNCYIT